MSTDSISGLRKHPLFEPGSDGLWPIVDCGKARIQFGALVSEKVAINEYYFPLRIHITNSRNPDSQKMVGLIRLQYAQSTEHQANLDVAGIQSLQTITKNTGWCKNIDATTTIDAAVSMKGGASILAVVNAGLVKNAVATANVVAAGYFGIYGTESEAGGRGAGVLYLAVAEGASIPAGIVVDTASTGTMTDIIQVPFGGAITNVLNFTETDGSTGAKVGQVADNEASDGCIKIKVGDTTYYIPFFTAANAAGGW